MNPYDLVSNDFLRGQYLSETPDDVADKMVELLDIKNYPTCSILEPSAGKGALIKAIIRGSLNWDNGPKVWNNRPFRFNVNYCELNKASVDECQYLFHRKPLQRDFLKLEGFTDFNRIILNPPFPSDNLHVEHALRFVSDNKVKLVALLHDYYLTSNEPRHISLRKELINYNTNVIPVGELKAVILMVN